VSVSEQQQDNAMAKDVSEWGRPYLERQYIRLKLAIERAEHALERVVCPSDEETHRGDIKICGEALTEVRRALRHPTENA
jgi:hypothetical protein